MTNHALIPKPTVQPTEILSRLKSGQRLRVNGCRGNAIIICHRHHSELAGPGAAVGGVFDLECDRVIPIGKVSIVYPQSRSERQKSYILRQKWILFTQKAMESYVPLQRAKNLLVLLEKYFEPQLIDPLSDEILARLVGVLPKTIGVVRQSLKSRQDEKWQKLHSVVSKS